ncbi:MAG: tRNA (N6-isopentenyl adenosine(37)-C2)-methylthiotransferase MiaB [Parcubacteria group bacterium]|nr:MAG: tRNA (N6-isopentenyl adenosine(37)-C2)-methylthiotransferase MiaB [Parcubacteria group bacterium]
MSSSKPLKTRQLPKKKFHLLIFGCQMNISDAERLAKILTQIGYEQTKNESEADLIAVVACAVRQKAVDRIHGKVRNWQLVKEKRPLVTLLSGCVLAADRKKLADKFDLFIDIKKLDTLPEQIQALAPEEKLALPDFFDIEPSYYSAYRAYVPIMTGCNKYCTYCAVPYTRGKEISRPSANILEEIQHLLEHGYKEIVLLGQNVNSYGLDKMEGIKFPELLQKIDKLGDNFWLKFLTSHPYDMSDKLIKVMTKTKNLNDYLHLPMQSGSDALLKRMNRHYSIAQYKKLIRKIKKSLPQTAISTDTIVGFCGETEKEFQATASLLKTLKFNMAYLSQYSQRAGTAAAKLYKDDVPKAVKKERWNKLNKILTKNSLDFNKTMLGQTRDALIDYVDKTGNIYNNIGKLSNYISVHIATTKPLPIGEFTQVKIVEAKAWGVKAEVVK